MAIRIPRVDSWTKMGARRESFGDVDARKGAYVRQRARAWVPEHGGVEKWGRQEVVLLTVRPGSLRQSLPSRRRQPREVTQRTLGVEPELSDGGKRDVVLFEERVDPAPGFRTTHSPALSAQVQHELSDLLFGRKRLLDQVALWLRSPPLTASERPRCRERVRGGKGDALVGDPPAICG
jgi:hypothetical protein